MDRREFLAGLVVAPVVAPAAVEALTSAPAAKTTLPPVIRTSTPPVSAGASGMLTRDELAKTLWPGIEEAFNDG